MLPYEFYRLGIRYLRPINAYAKLAHALFGNVIKSWPYFPFLRVADALSVMVERDTREYARPAFGLQNILINDTRYVVEEEIIIAKSFCHLLHFKKPGYKQKQPKYFIVAPLSGHYATLLRDTVAGVLPYFDVYITDWIDARYVPVCEGPFDLDIYVEYLLEFFHYFGGEVHVMAVCQPTVPVTMAASLLAQKQSSDQPRSLILLGGPIDTRVNPSKINRSTKELSLEWFKANVLTTVPLEFPGHGRIVCPGFVMLSSFMSLDPERHYESHLRLYEHLLTGSGEKAEAHTRFYDEYRSVMDLPAEYVLQTIQKVFHEHLLPQGLMKWREATVELSALNNIGIMTVEGELDNISCPGQTFAIHHLTPNVPDRLREHHLQRGTGHYGIFSGRRWRGEIVPLIERFVHRVNALIGKDCLSREKITSQGRKKIQKKQRNSSRAALARSLQQ